MRKSVYQVQIRRNSNKRSKSFTVYPIPYTKIIENLSLQQIRDMTERGLRKEIRKLLKNGVYKKE